MEFSERTGLGEREGEWQAVSGPFTLSESASARVDDATNTRATSVAALRDIAADVSQVIDTDGVSVHTSVGCRVSINETERAGAQLESDVSDQRSRFPHSKNKQEERHD